MLRLDWKEFDNVIPKITVPYNIKNKIFLFANILEKEIFIFDDRYGGADIIVRSGTQNYNRLPRSEMEERCRELAKENKTKYFIAGFKANKLLALFDLEKSEVIQGVVSYHPLIDFEHQGIYLMYEESHGGKLKPCAIVHDWDKLPELIYWQNFSRFLIKKGDTKEEGTKLAMKIFSMIYTDKKIKIPFSLDGHIMSLRKSPRIKDELLDKFTRIFSGDGDLMETIAKEGEKEIAKKLLPGPAIPLNKQGGIIVTLSKVIEDGILPAGNYEIEQDIGVELLGRNRRFVRIDKAGDFLAFYISTSDADIVDNFLEAYHQLEEILGLETGFTFIDQETKEEIEK